MDPKATYNLFLEAVEANNFEEALEHHTNLLEWLKAGGFEPDWSPRACKNFYKFEAYPAPRTYAPHANQFEASEHFRKEANKRGHTTLCCHESLECFKCGDSMGFGATKQGVSAAGNLLTSTCKKANQ